MPDRFIFPCLDVVCTGIIYCLSAPISNGGALRKSKIGELRFTQIIFTGPIQGAMSVQVKGDVMRIFLTFQSHLNTEF